MLGSQQSVVVIPEHLKHGMERRIHPRLLLDAGDEVKPAGGLAVRPLLSSGEE